MTAPDASRDLPFELARLAHEAGPGRRALAGLVQLFAVASDGSAAVYLRGEKGFRREASAGRPELPEAAEAVSDDAGTLAFEGGLFAWKPARGLSELLKTGWRPKRTLILALWDGEEWGLLGSTEWAEKHAAELRDNAAVYINTDSSGKGWLSVGGSHGLQQFMTEVARDVMDPRTGKPVAEESRRRQVMSLQGEAAANATALSQGQDVVVNALKQRIADESGVNVDQEMAYLISLQTAYGANARVLSTVKEMVDMLLSL